MPRASRGIASVVGMVLMILLFIAMVATLMVYMRIVASSYQSLASVLQQRIYSASLSSCIKAIWLNDSYGDIVINVSNSCSRSALLTGMVLVFQHQSLVLTRFNRSSGVSIRVYSPSGRILYSNPSLPLALCPSCVAVINITLTRGIHEGELLTASLSISSAASVAPVPIVSASKIPRYGAWLWRGSKLYANPRFKYVGIGTTNPQATLHVNGSVIFQNLPTGRGSYVLMVGPSGELYAAPPIYGGQDNDWLWNGNKLYANPSAVGVGIGTVNPEAPLEVVSSKLVRYDLVITNPNSVSLTNFQVRVDISSIGYRYFEIVTPSGVVVPYCFEQPNGECNTSRSSVIWVKVPFIPANGETVLYIINSSTNYAVSGSQVFDFYDSFTTLNTSRWYVYSDSGTVTIASVNGSSVLEIARPSASGSPIGVMSVATMSFVNETIECRVEAPTSGDLDAQIGIDTSWENHTQYPRWLATTNILHLLGDAGAGGDTHTLFINTSFIRGSAYLEPGVWYIARTTVVALPNGSVELIGTLGSETLRLAGTPYTTVGHLIIAADPDSGFFQQSSALYVDWVRVRKYAPQQPTAVIKPVFVKQVNKVALLVEGVTNTTNLIISGVKEDNSLGRILVMNSSGYVFWRDVSTIRDNDWFWNGNYLYANLSAAAVGIGTTSPRAKLEVVGSLMVSNPSNPRRFFLMYFGSLNDFAFNGSPMIIHPAWSSGYNPSGLIYISNSSAYIKVGIGTDSPQYRLDVNGPIRAIASTVLADYFRFTEGGKPTNFLWDYFPGTPVGNAIGVSHFNGTVWHGVFFINGSGYVFAPRYYITEEGDEATPRWYLDYMPSGNKLSLFYDYKVSSPVEVAHVFPNGSVWILGNIGTHGYSPDKGLPPGWGGGVHTWDVYAEGSVGLGRNGNLVVWISGTSDGQGFVFLNNTNNGAWARLSRWTDRFEIASSNEIRFKIGGWGNSGTDIAKINASGLDMLGHNVSGIDSIFISGGSNGIGAIYGPTNLPYIVFDATGMKITSIPDMTLSTNLRILVENPSGYVGWMQSPWYWSGSNIYTYALVGIGTDTPQYALDVNGDVRISGNLSTNGLNPDFYPSGWSGGGIHTKNLFAEGNVGLGNSYGTVIAMLGGYSDGQGYLYLYNTNDGAWARITRWTDRLEIASSDEIRLKIGGWGSSGTDIVTVSGTGVNLNNHELTGVSNLYATNIYATSASVSGSLSAGSAYIGGLSISLGAISGNSVSIQATSVAGSISLSSAGDVRISASGDLSLEGTEGLYIYGLTESTTAGNVLVWDSYTGRVYYMPISSLATGSTYWTFYNGYLEPVSTVNGQTVYGVNMNGKSIIGVNLLSGSILEIQSSNGGMSFWSYDGTYLFNGSTPVYLEIYQPPGYNPQYNPAGLYPAYFVCLSGGTCYLMVNSWSSLRYKTDIRPLASVINTSKIYELEPVVFKWRKFNTTSIGLIAEQVAKVLPILVTFDSKGRPEGIRYDLLPVLMLPELKKHEMSIRYLNKTVEEMKSEIEHLERAVSASSSSSIDELLWRALSISSLAIALASLIIVVRLARAKSG
ncbi:MAG: DUF2341 domain-containing protein [Crenarchaeota archaeon]|nr:DUF2341 domain-containing protein [Thermoproteota archaeon]